MKNGDTAAMPIPLTEGIDSVIRAASQGDIERFNKMMSILGGMTKREYFAAMAIQGLCENPDMRDAETEANLAVKVTDALLAELEKTKCAE